MARIKRAPRANPTRLQLAVRENDLEQVRLLIQQHKEAVQTATTATSPGALPSPSPSLANMLDFQGRTILQEALIQDNPAMARLILDEVAEEDAVRLISHTDERDRTALHEVALCNNGGDLSAVMECAKRMLQMGDVAAVFSSRFRTPLHEACCEGNLELVRLFLEFASCDSNNLDFSAILERRDRSGYTALFLATMQGHFDVVKLMIEYGANWYAPENYGRTPLSAAISYRQLDILNFLLDFPLHQQNAETKFDEMLSNLMGEACRAGYEEGTMALLKRGASTKAKDTNGRLPLHWACETGCLDLVKILVERSEMDATDLCLSDNNGNSPIRFALPHPHIVDYLVEHGYRDLFNQLLSAIHEGNVEKIESFLEGDEAIDVNFCNLEGETALLFAAGYDRLDVVKLLIHHGANLNGSFINVNGATDAEERLEVDSEDHSDWTPLVKAIGHGYFEIAEHLIDCGADVTIKGSASPLHYATERCCSSESDDRKTGYLKIIHRLLDNGSHVDSQHTNSGQTVLSTACCQNDIEMARLFLDHGAAVDIGDKGRFSDEKTPLIHASRELCLEIIRLLLDHGANPNLADSKGNSPLHWACNLGYRDDYASAHLLLAYGADALAENLKGETCADWAAHGPALDRHSWPPILDLVKACQANKVERVEELIRSQHLPGQVKITVSEAPSTLEWSDFVAGTVKMIQAGMDGNVDVLHSYQKVGLHSTLQAPSQPGEFVLHFVSRLGLVQSVEVLFEKDADPNVKQHDGRTALSLAAEAGHAAVVECLLQNGADANLADRLFNTPLHYACREGQVDVIRSLVSKDGCTVSTRNWLNETAADLCQVEDILDLLSSLQQTN